MAATVSVYLTTSPVASVALAFLLTILGFCLYNTVFHPLHRFPGPPIAPLTDFYKLYLFAGNNVHGKLEELHYRYGPIVRIAPNLLSVNDPTQLPVIYARNVDKTPFYSTGIAGAEPSLLQFQGHLEHRAWAKVLGPLMSMKFVSSAERSLDDTLIATMEKLSQRSKSHAALSGLDLSEYTRWYVYDSLTCLVYGKPAGMVSAERDLYGLISGWHRMFYFGGLIGTIPWLVHPIITAPILQRYLMPQKGHSFGAGKIMSVHEKLYADELQSLRENTEGAMCPSLLRQLATAKASGTPQLTPDFIFHQGFLATVAGQDTTASLISSLIHNVCSSPQCYTTLMDEIQELERRRHFSNPVVQSSEVGEDTMPYLNACIREVLRLDPPTPIPLPRFVPSGGLNISGFYVPGGAEVAVNPWNAGRSKALYGNDSSVFRPERWSLRQDEQTASDHGRKLQTQRLASMRKLELAWGFGDRRCIGKAIALTSARKFCAQLFRQFDIELVAGSEFSNIGINICKLQRVILTGRVQLEEDL